MPRDLEENQQTASSSATFSNKDNPLRQKKAIDKMMKGFGMKEGVPYADPFMTEGETDPYFMEYEQTLQAIKDFNDSLPKRTEQQKAMNNNLKLQRNMANAALREYEMSVKIGLRHKKKILAVIDRCNKLNANAQNEIIRATDKSARKASKLNLGTLQLGLKTQRKYNEDMSRQYLAIEYDARQQDETSRKKYYNEVERYRRKEAKKGIDPELGYRLPDNIITIANNGLNGAGQSCANEISYGGTNEIIVDTRGQKNPYLRNGKKRPATVAG